MPAQGFANSHALVVGIDAYQGGVAPLTTAVGDARMIARLLAEGQGYQVRTLLEAEASRDALLRALEVELPALLGPDDRVFLYFAGHGAALDGDDGPEGFLLPQDASLDVSSLVPMRRVAAAVKALPCRHVLLVLDCCFAGAFRWTSFRSLAPRSNVLYRRRYARFVGDRAAQVLTSAAADQKALDVFDGLTIGQRPVVRGHSPFASALMAGLSGAADQPGPDGEPDGVITATELYQYVRDVVEGATETRGTLQTPGLWPLPGHGRGEYVFRTDGPLVLPEDPRLDPAANPWRGLEAYGPEHAAVFFGREAAVDDIVARVPQAPFVCVLGASGAGKSSLVLAGVVPRVKALGFDVIGPVRPGAEPLTTVAPAVAAARAAAGPTVLLLDQFEEMFTACRSPEQRAAVLGLVAELVAAGGHVRLIVTLRSDFEASFLTTPLGPAMQRARHPVAAMTREALREVVQRPADARALYFEPPELVDRLVDDVALLPGGLPLLSFALSELYLRAIARGEDDRSLTADDYEDIGQVAGCLRRRAEAVYLEADDAGRQAMRRILLRMIALEGGGVARRRVTLSELRAEDAAEDAQIEARLTALTDARLLVRAASPTGEATFEPAHEALVLGWDRLVGWLDEEAQVLPLQRALWRAARDWRDAGEPRGRLWNDDPRLPQALSLSPSRRNPLETRFLQASEAWRLRRRRRTRALVGAVITVSLVAAVGGFWLAGKEAAARADAETAAERERTARGAAQAAAEAERTAKLAAESSERAAVEAQGEARTQAVVATAAAATDGGLAALLLAGFAADVPPAGAYEAALGLDRLELPLAILTTLPDPVAGVAFSEDGARLVAWAPPRAEVIEIATGIVLGEVTWPGLDAARLSPTGGELHIVHENGMLRTVAVAGVATLAPPPAQPPGRRWGVDWDWPAWDPRASTVAVHPQGALALTDARLRYDGLGWFRAQSLRASPTGFWRVQATRGGEVVVERLDPGGAVVESTTYPAATVRATCGLCGEAGGRGDDVVGVTVSPDGEELAVMTGGSFERDGCGASVCVAARGPDGALRRLADRSVRWREALLGDPEPGVVSLDLADGALRGCVSLFPHNGIYLEGRAWLQDRTLARRPQRCLLVGGGGHGPVVPALIGADGRLSLVAPDERTIAGPAVITAVALHQGVIATGHTDGGVRLWSRAVRGPVGTGWQPIDVDYPDDEDRSLLGPEGEQPDDDEPMGRWALGPAGVRRPPDADLALSPADHRLATGRLWISSDERLARLRLGTLRHAVWDLTRPSALPLPIPARRCKPALDAPGENGLHLDGAHARLLQFCEDGVFAAPATWPAVRARVAAAVRGCLSKDQRVTLLGEEPVEAEAGLAACRRTGRPLPVAAPRVVRRRVDGGEDPAVVAVAPPVAPPTAPATAPPPEPLPAIALEPPSAAAKAAGQALNVRGMGALGQGNRRAAMALFEQAVRADPAHHLARYNLACMRALEGEAEAALAILAAFKAADCVECRARVARARTDEDWRSLWGDARFQALSR